MKKITLITLSLLLGSCAPTIKNFPEYQKQFLTKSNFMPTKQNLEGKSPKVVVFALDENDNQVAIQAQLGNAIANNIENVLAQNRLAELVDRKAATKLQKEIALAEMNKTGSYKGPQVADYAISGTISNASFNSKYTSATSYVNPKTLQLVSIPAKFTYSANASGNIKVYELPSLNVIETIEFSGSKSRAENVQQNGGVNFAGLQIGGDQAKGVERDDGLVRRAGEEAVDDARIDLKNAFAKKGYILEKRVYKEKAIFKINLGSLDGLVHGDKLEITGQYENENAITGEIEVEKRIIGSATVTDKIDPKTCWIVIDDEDNINSVRLGDAVKVKYKKSSFDLVSKMTRSMLEQ